MPSQTAEAIAYQGEPGAYSEAAVERLFPGSTPFGCPSFRDVFEAVVSGAVARAVLPIENTLFGSVHPVYDLLPLHPLQITGEAWIRVQHCLLALPGVRMEELREVRSHPQALGQCAAFLRAHVPRAAPVVAHDTAGAARQLRESGERGVAVIASRAAAGLYDLAVLAEGIETHAGNFTRFLVLVRPEDDSPCAAGATKTSLSFCPFPGLDGALFGCFAAFGTRGIELLRVECRPRAERPLQHTYFLDVSGAATDPLVQEALEELRSRADAVRVYGSYPVAA